ncbi:CheB methylesterase domain-containing protein [Shouchella sp. 1P09AA]|uniref:CheB methylesterase domain-containing protein n=1 Tax=unclassified Shouchella TaxID=2893065 RepID=UPI0039A3C412
MKIEMSGTATDSSEFVVVIGCSTGGPSALQRVFEQLPYTFPYPIVVAQHMPAHFTALLASRLNERFPFTIKEAQHGERLKNGTIYISPGGQQTMLIKKINGAYIKVVEPQKGDLYHPSVNELFASTVCFKKKVLIILSGMGNDGAASLARVKESGSCVIAVESVESAVIAGMPNAAQKTGYVDEVLTSEEIGKWIISKGAFL